MEELEDWNTIGKFPMNPFETKDLVPRNPMELACFIGILEFPLCHSLSSNSCVFLALHPNILCFPMFSQYIGFKMSGHSIPSFFYSCVSKSYVLKRPKF